MVQNRDPLLPLHSINHWFHLLNNKNTRIKMHFFPFSRLYGASGHHQGDLSSRLLEPGIWKLSLTSFSCSLLPRTQPRPGLQDGHPLLDPQGHHPASLPQQPTCASSPFHTSHSSLHLWASCSFLVKHSLDFAHVISSIWFFISLIFTHFPGLCSDPVVSRKPCLPTLR